MRFTSQWVRMGEHQGRLVSYPLGFGVWDPVPRWATPKPAWALPSLCFGKPCSCELGYVVLALFSQRTTRTVLSDCLPTQITSSNPKICTMHHLASHADAHRMVRWGRSDQRWKAELELFKSVKDSQTSRLLERPSNALEKIVRLLFCRSFKEVYNTLCFR